MNKNKKIWVYTLLGMLLLIFNSCTKNEDNNNPTTSDTVSDIDGNVYHTVKIGNQIWMLENLKTTKYRNGDLIPNIADTLWKNLYTAAYCWYGNKIAHKSTYGAVYNWYAVSDSRNIAPTGWHVATRIEWETLIENQGGITIAGGKLKEAGTTHWTDPNTGATNSSGFTALPGGFQESIGGGVYGMGKYGDWWSSTSTSTTLAWNCELSSISVAVRTMSFTKKGGFSVRCVKDY
ncbi:MAG: fibrobacter succinogenes major paralogous domain-containing protein [Mariniphaga sp.]